MRCPGLGVSVPMTKSRVRRQETLPRLTARPCGSSTWGREIWEWAV